jgi:hypothetical protein
MPEIKAVPLHAKQTQFGVRGTAVPLLDSGTKREWVVSTMPQLPYTRERDPVLLVWEAGWASGVSLDGYRKFCPCQNLSLRLSSMWQVTMPTALSQPFPHKRWPFKTMLLIVIKYFKYVLLKIFIFRHFANYPTVFYLGLPSHTSYSTASSAKTD